MGIIRMDSIPLQTSPVGVRVRKLYETPDVRIMNLVIEPGQTVPEHSAPVDAFFYVVDGSGEITIGGTPFRVTATDILPCPAGTPMSLRAIDETFAVLNIKTPTPA